MANSLPELAFNSLKQLYIGSSLADVYGSFLREIKYQVNDFCANMGHGDIHQNEALYKIFLENDIGAIQDAISQTGTGFTPVTLFGSGESGWLHDTQFGSMFKNSAGTIESEVNETVRIHEDRSGNNNDDSQGTGTARAILRQDSNGNLYLEFDVVDDKYSKTAPAITGGTVAIFTSVGAWFDNIDVSAGSFDWGPDTYTGGPAGLFEALKDTDDNYHELGRIIIDRALTEDEKASLLSYYGNRGCPGEITLSAQILSNNDFSAGSTDWVLEDPDWSITGGQAISAGTASLQKMYQTVALTSGETYLMTTDVDSISFGAVNQRIYTPGQVTGEAAFTAGKFSALLTAVDDHTRAGLITTGASGSDCVINYIELYRVIFP